MTEEMKQSVGRVWLVGAGPGSADLNTSTGTALLAADVVVVDGLARRALECGSFLSRQFSENPPEVIDVGKRSGGKGWEQEKINNLLIEKAKAGHTVVRLKGGDPFIFGRGLEELSACREAEIPCEVVPGVSSATAAATAAGIPLTLRGVAASFHVMSGHLGETPGDESERWRQAAKFEGTLLIMMGVDPLEKICARLIAGGMPESTPAALIENGGLPNQRVVVGVVSGLAGLAEKARIHSPAVAVIGDVVSHRIPPFSSDVPLPLRGVSVVVCSSRELVDPISLELGRMGADVRRAPMMAMEPRRFDEEEIQELVDDIRACDHMLFTSGRAVSSLLWVLNDHGLGFTDLEGVGVIAVGQATAHEVRTRLGAEPAIGSGIGAEGLSELDVPLSGQRVLWLRGADARPEARRVFADHGASLSEQVVYGMRRGSWSPSHFQSLLHSGEIDYAIWTSPRVAEIGLGDLAENERADLCQGVTMLAIGETTAGALRDMGMNEVLVSTQPSASALATTLFDHLAEKGKTT